MKAPRLILAGGGSADDSAPLDKIFASWTGLDGRMLYLPVAGEDVGGRFEAGLRWLSSVFEPLGVRDIEMWSDLRGHTPEELQRFDSVYIGGGNTFRLLSEMKESGFDSHLAEYFRQGGAIYGGSAGAVVMGRNILTAAQFDHNDVALIDTRGLDLARGHSIWCHYTELDDPAIYEYIHKYAFPVLAISERAGVGIEGERMTALGYEPTFRFTRRRKTAFEPGASV